MATESFGFPSLEPTPSSLPPTPEREEKLQSIVERGAEEALRSIQEKFESRREVRENLPFHNTEHTRKVIERVEQILQTLQKGGVEIPLREMALGKLVAAFHDVVQAWQEKKMPDGSIRRDRALGKNEAASAEAAIAFMHKDENDMMFNEEDDKTVRSAILATVPGWDREQNTVTQPNLNEQSSAVTRALAFADLAGAGMDGKEQYLKEGKTLFREENLDILEAMQTPGKLSQEQKENFKQRMLNWSKFQSTFARGRKVLFEKELMGLPEAAKGEIRKLFSRFDESIQAAEEQAKRQAQMSFEALAKDFGYI